MHIIRFISSTLTQSRVDGRLSESAVSTFFLYIYKFSSTKISETQSRIACRYILLKTMKKLWTQLYMRLFCTLEIQIHSQGICRSIYKPKTTNKRYMSSTFGTLPMHYDTSTHLVKTDMSAFILRIMNHQGLDMQGDSLYACREPDLPL